MHTIKAALGRRAVMLAGLLLVAALAIPGIASGAPIRIYVDPGHGGHDPGAQAQGVKEKDVNLAIGNMVAAAAIRQGWDVGVTRGDDHFVELNTRARAAAFWGATDFVSIHSNSIDGNPRGSMTIQRGGASGALGQAIMDQLAPLSPGADIGNRGDTRGLAVLRGSKMPAVLVEVLSMSSPEELAKLANPEWQARYAEAIVRGIAVFHGVQYVPPPAPPAPEAAKRMQLPREPRAASAESSPGKRVRVAQRPQSPDGGWFGELVTEMTREEPLTLHPAK